MAYAGCQEEREVTRAQFALLAIALAPFAASADDLTDAGHGVQVIVQPQTRTNALSPEEQAPLMTLLHQDDKALGLDFPTLTTLRRLATDDHGIQRWFTSARIASKPVHDPAGFCWNTHYLYAIHVEPPAGWAREHWPNRAAWLARDGACEKEPADAIGVSSQGLPGELVTAVLREGAALRDRARARPVDPRCQDAAEHGRLTGISNNVGYWPTEVRRQGIATVDFVLGAGEAKKTFFVLVSLDGDRLTPHANGCAYV